MDLDNGAVTAALRQGPDVVRYVKRYNLAGKFLRGPAARAWQVVERHVEMFGELPKIDTIQKEEPEFRPVDGDVELLDWYVQELRFRDRQESYESLGPSIGRFVVEKKLDKAEEAMRKFLREEEERKHSNTPMYRNIFDLVPQVKQRYYDMKEGKIGVPWPWPKLNSMTLGSEPGDMTGIIARLGMGKTQTLIVASHYVWKFTDKKVLFVSPEMKQISLAQRLYSYDAKIPQGKVRRGSLDAFVEAKFMEHLDELHRKEGFIIVDDSFRITLDMLETVIDLVRPDILYLDGAYLVLADPRASSKENAEMVADGIKITAKKKGIPIVFTSQFNRTVQKNDLATFDAGAIGLSDRFGWNADNLIAMIQTDDHAVDREMLLKGLKMREAERDPEIRIHWDWENQNFMQVGAEERGGFEDKDYQTFGGEGAPETDADGGDQFPF